MKKRVGIEPDSTGREETEWPQIGSNWYPTPTHTHTPSVTFLRKKKKNSIEKRRYISTHRNYILSRKQGGRVMKREKDTEK